MNGLTRTGERILVWCVSLSLLACSGCAVLVVGGAAAAGAGTVAWVKGQLNATLDGSLDRVWTASKEALKELQMPVTIEEKNGLEGRLVARAAGDRKVTIQLKKATGTTTEVGIRVGTWGDQAMSQQILDAIKKHL